MEVLNAAGIAPLHKPNPETRKQDTTRKLFPTKSRKTQKLNLAAVLSRTLHGGIAALSSALGASAAAGALTYEEALQQGLDGSSSYQSFDSPFGIDDVGQLVDGLVRFGSENPLVVGGGFLVLAVPLIVSQVLGKPRNWGVQSAKFAYSSLSEDGASQLVDIRQGKEIKESGSPDLRSPKKKVVSIAFDRDDKEEFLKKLSLRFKDPGNTTLYILDKFDGNSELVAQLAAANGFKAVYAIKDGAEGPRGWKKSGLPWAQPRKAIALDFGDFKTAISEVLGEGTDNLPVTLGLAAATGLGVLAFSEIETVLQLLGSAALFQFATKKLLFAEDRKVTLQQIDEFLTTKIAPKELVDEIKMIGKALLPVSTSTKASAPEPVEEKPDVSSVNPSSIVVEPPIVPQEAEPDSHSGKQRPLSPYPNYPDFKPPSSPCPTPP